MALRDICVSFTSSGFIGHTQNLNLARESSELANRTIDVTMHSIRLFLQGLNYSDWGQAPEVM